MDVRTTDRLIDFASLPSNMASPATFGSVSAHREERGDNTVFSEPEDQYVASNGLGQLNVFFEQPFTAPEQNLGTEANNPSDSNYPERGRNEHPKNYKKRAECFEIFHGIQNVLRDQLHQIQTIVFEGKELEYMLRELSKGEVEPSLLLAMRTLNSSLVGVRHILKGNILMMRGLDNTSGLCEAAQVPSGSAQPSPALGMPDNGIESPETADNEADLLLNDVSPDVETTGITDVNIPGDQATNIWNITSPGGADPFVDTTRRDAVVQLNLEFHPDVTELEEVLDPKLYVSAQTANAIGMQSRRVILKNLPPDATLPHITRGIRCNGGLVSIHMLNTAPIFGNGTKTVMLEFVHCKSAAEFTSAANTSHLIYEAKNGDQYRAAAWLIPSSSYPLGKSKQGFIDSKGTRALLLKGFPKECIWYFISAVGVKNIVRADYDEINDGFTVELTTLFQANKVDWFILSGRFSDFYHYAPQEAMFRMFMSDSTHAFDSKYNPRPRESPLKHRPEDDLEGQWNRYPYNDYVRRHFRKSATQGPTRLPLQTRLALQYDIDESEVDDYLDDLENHQDTEYRLIGSSITLTRRKWGWSMSAEDEGKLLLENTLHEPDWADHWDGHFKSCGEINRRKWEHYGMLAKHRREKAAEQGLDLETMPKCGRGCEMGCHDMKAAPVSAVVKKFLDTSKRVVINTGYGE